MTEKDIQKFYDQNVPSFKRLATNLKQALEGFLVEAGISYHSVNYRIKKADSYLEKIERKGYSDPTEEIEDFCGLRIICFYPYDLSRIGKMISQEFDVLESIDKVSALDPDRFGYRSNHYIVKIKSEWSNAPNYRGLDKLKAEIQVRTILMHTWADIEHKLAYKKHDEIPQKFRRKLYQLSALLEIADEQFQNLKNEKEELKASLITDKKGKKEFDYHSTLNLDTLQAYLDFRFSERRKSQRDTGKLLHEMKNFNLTIRDLEDSRIKSLPIINSVEEEIIGKKDYFSGQGRGWTQVGAARAILDLCKKGYMESRSSISNSGWGETIYKWKDKLKTVPNNV